MSDHIYKYGVTDVTEYDQDLLADKRKLLSQEEKDNNELASEIFEIVHEEKETRNWNE